MAVVVFNRFPKSMPVPIAPGKSSELFGLPGMVGHEEVFIRVVALWKDNTPFPDAKPIFQFRVGESLFTSVGSTASGVDLPSAGIPVAATAKCELLDDGVYLITVANIMEEAAKRAWKFRIRNDADQTQRFSCVSSDREPNTRQPWIAFGNQQVDDPGPAAVRLASQSLNQFVTVRNWGTKPLELFDELGQPVGGEESPVTLVDRPSLIPPHGVDHIVLQCGKVDAKAQFSYEVACNDKEKSHFTLKIEVDPSLT